MNLSPHKILAAISFVAVLSGPVVGQTDPAFLGALDDYEAHDYHAALPVVESFAQDGVLSAQVLLGTMYDYGLGMPEDNTKAVEWYIRAATQGDPTAQFMIGTMYQYGDGIAVDHAEAAKWYRAAGQNGDPDAQYELAVMYDAGQGVPKDYSESANWYRLAADSGHAGAQFNLGIAYRDGEGVPANLVDAAYWFRRAANQGHHDAQYALGYAFAIGEGVTEDIVEAYFLFSLADEGGTDSSKPMEIIREDLSPYQLRSINERVQNWVAREESTSSASSVAEAGSTAAAMDRAASKGSELVSTVQSGLSMLGYYSGEADGLNGRSTKAAIREFQSDFEIDVTGDVTSDLALYVGAALGLSASSDASSEKISKSGSGFVVSADGYLITNAHVVEECASVSLADNTALNVEAFESSSDLALLKTTRRLPKPALPLRTGRGLRLGESVLVGGFPLSGFVSSDINITTGAVSALSGPGQDRRLFQLTAPVQVGNSGGPVLDSAGNIVGVVVSKLDALSVASQTGDVPQNVNFAISLGTLQSFLDAHGVNYEMRPSSLPKANVDLAELARASTVRIECHD